MSWLAPTFANAQTTGIYRERFMGLSRENNSLAQLTNDLRFINNTPTTNTILSTFRTESGFGDDYGQRLRAFITAPADGNYNFAIASDEVSQLFLSTDENPANKRLIAYCDPRVVEGTYNQFTWQSASNLTLQAGRRYYVEVLHKEANLLDHLAVQWRLPNGALESPIPGTRCAFEIPPLITKPLTNLVIEENRPAVFSVELANFLPQSIRWQRDGVDVPTETNLTLALPAVTLDDNGARFRAFITNRFGATNTEEVRLTVTRDTTPPVVTRVIAVSSSNLLVTFSEPVDALWARQVFPHYSRTGGNIFGAEFAGDTSTIRLDTVPMTYGSNYVLTVRGVPDRASAPNTNVTAMVNFGVQPFSPMSFESGVPGSIVSTTNGTDVTSSGRDIGGTTDDFGFGFQMVSGDFDFRVRVASFDATDIWAKAGLMARESLTATSRFVAVLSTPTLAGTFFQYRTNAGGLATASGAYLTGYPDLWLRLRRVGNEFTGFAGRDGANWTPLGSINAFMSGRLFLGFPVTSQDTNRTVTAQFRDFGKVSAVATASLTPPPEPLGPSSRKTGLVISEIMYHPRDVFLGTNRAELEFVELFNSNPFPEDLSSYRLTGDVNVTFRTGTVIQGGSFLVVARRPGELFLVQGVTNALSGLTNNLPDDAGRLRLRNARGDVLLEVNYSANYPWPIAADGPGHSLVLARPSYGEDQRAAWAASDVIGGSPGRAESFGPEPLRAVVINEFLAHTDAPLLDYIELHNASDQSVDVSGAWLSDSPATNKFRIPSPTVIAPRGFVVFDQAQLGFSLSSAGERIFLVNSNQTRVIDAVGFEGQANGVSFGRYPDGAPGFQELSARTPGAANATPLTRDIVINEIMYHPISENPDDEFVELFNKGTSAVDLGGWRFTDGINFSFPSNTFLAAGGYLVVAKSRTNLLAHYPHLFVSPSRVFGDFGGNLRDRGERLALSRPEIAINADNPLNITTNTIYVVVDEVEFGTGGRWGHWSDGGGSSLELIDPRADNRLAPNWADSDESAKAPWTFIEFTGALDLGLDTANALHVMLLEEGECLLDDVEVRVGLGANLVPNGGFESGLGTWGLRGNHQRSSLATAPLGRASLPRGPDFSDDERSDVGAPVASGPELRSARSGESQGVAAATPYLTTAATPAQSLAAASLGFNSANALHIRATSRGDIGANKVFVNLTSTPTGTATIRGRARWLRGWPELLLRLRGSYLEATDRLLVPPNLGTPGAPNSRLVANAAPAITDVTHNPPVPAANESVVVTARVADPDGIGSVTLKYRVDPSPNFTSLPMNDAGQNGDAVPGDTLVAFVIEAVDNAPNVPPVPVTSRFPAARDDNGPPRECLVHFGSPTIPSSFGTYRFWITRASITNWSTREVMSNERIPGTFVYGNHRVIYGAGARYSGSAAHQDQAAPDFSPVGTPNNYSFDLPKDDLLLGTDNFNKVHGAGNNHHDDGTLLREVTAYAMARQLGLAANYKRSVIMFINGARRGSLMEDTQVPNGEVIDEVFPDDPNGDLYKISVWYEFGAPAVVLPTPASAEGYLNNYTTTGGAKKRARYRWNWQGRALHGTANDYTNLYQLVDAANAPTNAAYAPTLEGFANIEQWMRVFALQHCVGNWDSFGYRNFQNMFAYKPERAPWELLIWDINIVFGGGTRSTPVAVTDTLFEFDTADTGISAIYDTPRFRRYYWQGLQDVANGPFVPANIEPFMDARFAAFEAAGVSVSSPIAIKTWIAQRRAYVLSQLAAANPTNFSVATTDFTSSSNFVAISGVAPFDVRAIEINGVAWPIVWTTVTNWTLRLPLAGANNALSIVGLDARGRPIVGASNHLTINFTGALADPRDFVVINEIMYNPLTPEASFVEIWNTSTNFAFDLSGWRLNGADFTFPEGTILTNRQFLVIAKNRQAFTAVYGVSNAVAGEFAGQLDDGGETLSLIKPGTTPALDVVIDRVRYDDDPPWPARADGSGPSLQLIDAAQDNSRVANWSDGFGWRFFSITGTPGASATNLLLWLSTGGEVLIDRVWLAAGTTPESGVNLLQNGGFDSGALSPWQVTGNHSNSAVTTGAAYDGQFSLRVTSSVVGGPTAAIGQSFAELNATDTVTLSFWYLPSTNGVGLNYRLSATIRSTTPVNFRPIFATPGAVNTAAARLEPFPPLWLNEVQANNASGIRDGQGEREPWIELYNAGPNPVSLDGLWLADDFTNVAQWAFPAGRTLAAGEFKIIWADGETNETSGAEWHTSFRLAAPSGSVALARAANGQPQVLDYLSYAGLGADLSFGSGPDDQPFDRRVMQIVTPGTTNRAPEVAVFVNEWLAGNTNNLADPADGDFEDWFELFNAGTNAVDLTGYFLSDNPADRRKFRIPDGTVIPPGGFLLVWADEESGQNSTNRLDLHVNFRLALGGEAIGLYSPAGAIIDEVAFGAQTNDVSQGRFADGAATIYFFRTPTPRAHNSLTIGHTGPMLAPIPDRIVTLGQTLAFTATATDSEVPPEILSFSLDGAPPSGANLDIVTGRFTWTPTAAQTPSTNTFTLRVTDNGTPPLSATRNFTIIVVPPPRVTRVARLLNGDISLTWPTLANKRYRVDYKNTLSDPNWLPLSRIYAVAPRFLDGIQAWATVQPEG